ncbi:MAG: SMI1/KNR4 family protein, partial [Lachnospiraceae bacterium]|nr:SMI1/KNR4 family protein [Lachnospiraceae bacterium]
IKTLRALKKMGARMTVTEEKYGEVYEEFGPPKKKTRSKETSATDESVIEEIRRRWNLPQSYLDYLRTHPKSMSVEAEDEETLERIEISVYGANDLIRCQDGYSYNPVEKCVIEDWDNKLIVIADADADPFCLDITAANSPVYYAMHGMDEWDFDVFSESFEEFLEFLGLS